MPTWKPCMRAMTCWRSNPSRAGVTGPGLPYGGPGFIVDGEGAMSLDRIMIVRVLLGSYFLPVPGAQARSAS